MKNLFSKIKDKIAKERYTTSFKLKVLIIVCWVIYIACLIIKLCGGNRFEIATSNETFTAICDYIDNTLWLKMIIACIFNVILSNLSCLAILEQKTYNLRQCLIFIPLSALMSLLSWFYPIISTILNFLFYLLTIIYLRRKRYRSIIGIVLINLFQFISLITKNVNSININEESTLVSIILQIDVLIIVIIYYLYANARKEIKD